MKRIMWMAQLIGLALVLVLAVTCSVPQATPTLTTVPPIPTVPSPPTPVPPTTAPTAVPPVPTAPAPPTAVQGTPAPAEFVWKITGDPNSLSKPVSVAVDAEGNVYILDAGNSRVQKFDRNGKFLLMWGSKGNGDGQFDIHTAGMGRLAVDAQENVYVIDFDNYRIQKFDGNGKFLTKWGSIGTGDGQFTHPRDMTVDKQGNVYVADWRNENVQEFDNNGRLLLRWGTVGLSDGDLMHPMSVAIDGQGNVLVSDTPGRLQKFDGSGKFISKYAKPTGESAVMDLWKIALDGQGNIYVAANNIHHIVKLDSNANPVAVWGSEGSGEGEFEGMRDVAVDKDGNIYVTDDVNNCVQKFRQSSYHP